MVDERDVRYALGLLCERFCNYVFGARHGTRLFRECMMKCEEMVKPMEELMEDIVRLLHQHGKEIGRIEKDLIKVMMQ